MGFHDLRGVRLFSIVSTAVLADPGANRLHVCRRELKTAILHTCASQSLIPELPRHLSSTTELNYTPPPRIHSDADASHALEKIFF